MCVCRLVKLALLLLQLQCKPSATPEHSNDLHPPPYASQGCKVLIAIEKAKLDSGVPDPDSAYWN